MAKTSTKRRPASALPTVGTMGYVSASAAGSAATGTRCGATHGPIADLKHAASAYADLPRLDAHAALRAFCDFDAYVAAVISRASSASSERMRSQPL